MSGVSSFIYYFITNIRSILKLLTLYFIFVSVHIDAWAVLHEN